MIDPRIVRVGIELDGVVNSYEDLAISASGVKFANPNQGECTVDIANLSRDVRQYLLKEASPFNQNRKRKRIIIEVGRESYGTSVMYTGDIYRAYQGQPTDIITTLKCITGGFQKGEIISRDGRGIEKLSSIARRIASDNSVGLQFLSKDKNISNYSYTGSALGQVDKLAEMSDSDVFIDGDILVVKPRGSAMPGSKIILSMKSGMIGTPERTERGARVKILYDPSITLGTEFELQTDKSPELEGDYVIYKLNYHVTNRDVPFYYIAEARKI